MTYSVLSVGQNIALYTHQNELQNRSYSTTDEKIQQLYQDLQGNWHTSPHVATSWSDLSERSPSPQKTNFKAALYRRDFRSIIQTIRQAKDVGHFIALCKKYSDRLHIEDVLAALKCCTINSKSTSFMQEKTPRKIENLNELFIDRIGELSSTNLKETALLFSQFDKKNILEEIATVFSSSMPFYSYLEIEDALSLLQDPNCTIDKTSSRRMIESVEIRLRFDTSSFSFFEIAALVDMLFSLVEEKQNFKDLVEHLAYYFLHKKPDLPKKERGQMVNAYAKKLIIKMLRAYRFMQWCRYANVDEMIQWLKKQLREQKFRSPLKQPTAKPLNPHAKVFVPRA